VGSAVRMQRAVGITGRRGANTCQPPAERKELARYFSLDFSVLGIAGPALRPRGGSTSEVGLVTAGGAGLGRVVGWIARPLTLRDGHEA
jgi:hypothetical protein